jgi:ABC-2 type transport system permease protein
MTLEEIRYRGWSDRLRPGWFAVWPIARTGLLLVLRRKVFWVLLALAALDFLFLFATIYLKAQITTQNPGLRRFVDNILSNVTGSGETYRDFMFAQGTVTMLLLALAGTTLVGDDIRSGGMTFYLSRRIHRGHYLIGKLLSIGLLVSLTTTLPALLLYLEYGLLTESTSYFRENLGILWGILGYGLTLAVVLSCVLFALASWLPRTVPLVMAWTGVFAFLPAAGGLLRQAFDDRRWLLLGLWRDVRLVGTWCFGGIDTDRELELLYPSMMIVAAVCVVSIACVIPRLRGARVVA